MSDTQRPPVPLASLYPSRDDAAWEQRSLSPVATGIVGSQILKVAGQIRAMIAEGHDVCNLTVGDFAPSQFPIPKMLEDGIVAALRAGNTNYPPADGIPELRQAIAAYYERELGLAVPVESVLVAAGARPVIYCTFRTIVNRGEKVIYPVPSWNCEHYVWLSEAEGVCLETGPETGFLPTADAVRPLLPGARLLCVNTPQNPSGTVMTRQQVEDLATLIVEENERRARTGERALFVMWDQVYWTLTYGDAQHYTPPGLVPESAPWTIFIDGISKSVAATGLRVGWTVAAPPIIARMKDILGHVGAWAPKPEQVATAALLNDQAALDECRAEMTRGARERLELLHDGFDAMKADGLPVDSFTPQGAIYLSVRFDLVGRRIDGKTIETNEDIRKLLLMEAGFGVVPFQAFGLPHDTGWMRTSVGAVSPDAIREALPRVRALLERAK